MNNAIFEIIKSVCPAIIAGIITFLITKYTYHKNRPLDKLEITYNRVYYPIYKLIKEKKSQEDVIKKCDFYFLKYNKYVNKSTLIAFDLIKIENERKKIKKLYGKFITNIYSQNSYLRRKLGYLEPSFFNIYSYSSSFDKRICELFLCLMIIYILAIFAPIFSKLEENKIIIIVCVIFIFSVASLIEGVIIVGSLFFRWLQNRFSRNQT